MSGTSIIAQIFVPLTILSYLYSLNAEILIPPPPSPADDYRPVCGSKWVEPYQQIRLLT